MAIDIAVVLNDPTRLATVLEFFGIREGEYGFQCTNATKHLVSDVPAVTKGFFGESAYLINWSE